MTGGVEGEDDDPVVDVVGPLATGDEIGRHAERGEQPGDRAVTPGDERMIAVRLRSQWRDECGWFFGADGAVQRKAGGAAERLEREARTNAVRGVRAGVERVDADVETALMEGLEVVDVGVGAGFTGACELAAEQRLLRMAHDENGVAGEMVGGGGCVSRCVGGGFCVD